MKLLPLIIISLLIVALLIVLSDRRQQIDTASIQERAAEAMDSLSETAQNLLDQVAEENNGDQSEPAMTAAEVWQHIDTALDDPNKARVALLDRKEYIIEDQVSRIRDGYLLFTTPEGPVTCVVNDNPDPPWDP